MKNGGSFHSYVNVYQRVFHLFTLLQKVPDLTEKSYVFLPGSNTSVTQRISPSETGFQMVSPDPPRSRRIQHDTATGGREMLVAL